MNFLCYPYIYSVDKQSITLLPRWGPLEVWIRPFSCISGSAAIGNWPENRQINTLVICFVSLSTVLKILHLKTIDKYKKNNNNK